MYPPISDTPQRAISGEHELTPALADRLARAGANVVVLGDVVLDVWMWGRSERVCREAPVPVVDIERSSAAPGGAANTAANLAALGARVRLVTTVGTDRSGERLRAALRGRNVPDGHVVSVPDRSTAIKRRIVAGDQLMVRFDETDRRGIDDTVGTAVQDRLTAALDGADALVICDYDGGCADRARRWLTARRPELPLLVVDSHHPARWRSLRPDVATPNAAEAAASVSLTLPADGAERAELLDHHRTGLLDATGAATVAVTLDRDGVLVLSGDRPVHRTWARPVPDRQSAGGGDTFTAAYTLALLAGLPGATAAEVAQAAADVVVHSPGTSVCDTAALRQRLAGAGGVLDAAELAAAVAAHRRAGRRIVFTNGCFDVLHTGHIAYLDEAKRLGDILVVAVNSDRGVRALKGPDRPVNSEHDRATVLAALSCVDHVTIFDEPTPAALLRRLRPELYVKGGDYRPEMLAETSVVHGYGGEVRALGYVADHSTSAIIDRIRVGAGR
ncbi:D-glycero-beta-D-manno-heptose 1-phosphate adenylyltransferase [Nocardia sp. BMG51109]|uniref:D-glycero-beta-D-manno-heptose 1-phosphate adenylyltransferase n=1 Tax=Nocardia sp. BMG51109 TaxID=1056816 RepID=UPI0004B96CB2|nr:D-glycero-beta-D-manno-heptose 1-phosphate adenylyltransferase [Nocardia sp. BMG51109]